MTDKEKMELFERAGITQSFINETEQLIDSGDFFDGSWTVAETHEPVIIQIEMDPVAVVTLDRKARANGMTRAQFITALATA